MTSNGIVASAWGELTRGTFTLTDGEVLVDDYFSLPGEPELMVRTTDPVAAAALLPRLEAFFADRDGWHRRATDAVVTRFSEQAPTSAELDEAEGDLVLQTVEVLAGGEVVLHLDDSCGQHFPDGYWPAVRFGTGDVVAEVTVEA
ncbi:hypothetical protein NODU109028_16805 [Nocardioides dubius]|uniref:DUF2262 domain-containing protein n=1 Tax=Nocardioides dubius TaxID=317019 RepID=A0ABP4EF82_9ACTN